VEKVNPSLQPMNTDRDECWSGEGLELMLLCSTQAQVGICPEAHVEKRHCKKGAFMLLS